MTQASNRQLGRSGARRWIVVMNALAFAAVLGSFALLQRAAARDCRTKQLDYGFQSCIREEHATPALDWSVGARREVLWAIVEGAAWMKPLAADEEARRGAAQLLVESTETEDVPRIVEAMQADRLSPEFAALMYALAWSKRHDAPPALAEQWLAGSRREKLFGALVVAMLSGERGKELRSLNFDPLDAGRPGIDGGDSADAVAIGLFQRPLDEVAADYLGRLGELAQRDRGAIAALLLQCPRSWSGWF